MEKLLYDPLEIDDKVMDLSEEMNSIYVAENGSNIKTPVLCPILQGGAVFFNNLARGICFDAYVDYLGIRSYKGREQGELDIYKGLDVDVEDKDVWLIDDICDTGKTFDFLEEYAYAKGAHKVYKCALLKRHNTPTTLDLYGFEIKDEWVFGYGMDHPDGLGRLLDGIFVV
tara:strand:- start:470 stop:982 length:513 start_codon:yes stop_codon:yes gene_type:complete